MKNLLITGRPGVGKTTLVRRLVERPMPGKAVGFFTQEIREENRRTGFGIETTAGEKGLLASVHMTEGPKVGRYRVNMRDLERIAVQCIYEGVEKATILLIDEIGKMELLSRKFRDAVVKAFDSPVRVIATVKMGEGGFTARLRHRDDTGVLLLTEKNRDDVLRRVIRFVGGPEGRKGGSGDE